VLSIGLRVEVGKTSELLGAGRAEGVRVGKSEPARISGR
jgi:hypothetical protein